MAFLKNPSHIKTSILAFVKHIVSKKIYKAFELILSPCCNPVLLSAEANCHTFHAGFYDLTFKLDAPVNTLGIGFVTAYFMGSYDATISHTIVNPESSTVTFTNVYLPGTDTYSVNLVFTLPTKSPIDPVTNPIIGVSFSTNVVSMFAPDCL